jgi:hypothetical protein
MYYLGNKGVCMKKYFLLVTLVALVGLSACTNSGSSNTPARSKRPAPTREPLPIQMTGTAVCLPHKNKTGAQTTECAFGIEVNKGEYYGLDISSLQNSGQPDIQVNQKIQVMGNLTLVEDSLYDIKGTIRVNSYKAL